MRGSRVQAVVGELQGEKIDIIPWSPSAASFIVNALQPAEVAKVVLDEDAERIEVVVPDDQLSLAIGRRGQNVRLASQLTGRLAPRLRPTGVVPRRRQTLAVFGNDTGVVHIWQPATGRRLVDLDGLGMYTQALAIAWSSNGDRLAVGYSRYHGQPSLRLFNASTGKLLMDLEDAPVALAWSPDGGLLASSSQVGVRLWDVRKGEPTQTLPLKYGSNGTEGWRLAFSSDGKTLAVVGKPVVLIDVKTGKEKEIGRLEWPEKQSGWYGEPRWLAGDKEFLAGAVVWDVMTGKVDQAPGVILAPDGRTFVAWEGATQETFQIGDAASGKILHTLSGHAAPYHPMASTNAALAPDGKTLATFGPSISYGVPDSLWLWDTTTGEREKTIRFPAVNFPAGLFWSADGKTCLVTYSLSNVGVSTLVDVASGGTSRIPLVASWPASSPQGTTWAGGEPTSNAVVLYDVSTGQSRKFSGHTKPVTITGWSPDGKRLASASEAETLIWDVAKGTVECRLKLLPGYTLRWSPDGRYLDSSYQLWDIEKDSEVPLDKVGNFMGWTPDGKVLYALTADQPPRVVAIDWSSPKRERLRSFPADYVGHIFQLTADCKQATWFAKCLGSAGSATEAPQRASVVLTLRNGRGLAVSAEGHYRLTGEDFEDEIRYVVQTDKGQETLKPSEFATKHGWKNDPSQVRLIVP